MGLSKTMLEELTAGIETPQEMETLYARGMTTRDIEGAIRDLYGVEISHALIAQVTDAVLDG